MKIFLLQQSILSLLCLFWLYKGFLGKNLFTNWGAIIYYAGNVILTFRSPGSGYPETWGLIFPVFPQYVLQLVIPQALSRHLKYQYDISSSCEYKYYFRVLTTEKKPEVKRILLLTPGKKKYSPLFCMGMIVWSPLHGFQRYSALTLIFSSYQGTIFSVLIFLSFSFCIKFVQRHAITEYLFNTEYSSSLYLKTCSSFTWSITVLINSSWSL